MPIVLLNLLFRSTASLASYSFYGPYNLRLVDKVLSCQIGITTFMYNFITFSLFMYSFKRMSLPWRIFGLFPSQVSSYGGFLTYQSKSFGIPSEGMTLMDRRPDVVLTVCIAASLLDLSLFCTVYLSEIYLVIFPPRDKIWLWSTCHRKSHILTSCIRAESSSWR